MSDHLKASQFYFPYYKIDPNKSEVALREYDLAAKALESDQRSLNVAVAIALFFSGSLATFVGSGSGVVEFKAFADKYNWRMEACLSVIVLLRVRLRMSWMDNSAEHETA